MRYLVLKSSVNEWGIFPVVLCICDKYFQQLVHRSHFQPLLMKNYAVRSRQISVQGCEKHHH